MHPAEILYSLASHDSSWGEDFLMVPLVILSAWILLYPLVFLIMFFPFASTDPKIRRILTWRAGMLFGIQPLLWYVAISLSSRFDWIAIGGHELYWNERIIIALPCASLLTVILINAFICAQIRSGSLKWGEILQSSKRMPATYLALVSAAITFAQIRAEASSGPFDNSFVFYMWVLVALQLTSIWMLFKEVMRKTLFASKSPLPFQKLTTQLAGILSFLGFLLPIFATPSF